MTTAPRTPAPLTPASVPVPRLDALGLIVADMAASLAFYRLLGLDLPAEADTAPHAEATLPGGLRVLFDTEETVRSYDPGWTRPAGGGGRIGLAFLCAGPAEVDATHHALVAAGYRSHLEPWDAVWGQRYAVVLDPDGCEVSLFASAA
ncbi:VOC family protein [Streptomyces sp. NPDC093109]|uniref:VOC family protein n=1 Tax=Streptomyces sp. NPDC093109 TaxID=3154977 RepID=UPI0034501854